MTVRQLKRRAQEMHGYRNTRSSREPSGGLDPFTGVMYPKSSVRFYIAEWNPRAVWRPYP